MELGNLLNEQFVAETKNLSVENSNEKKLFEALNRAFDNLSAKNTEVKCSVIHGARSLVSFDEISGYPAFYAKDRGNTVKCELADLLIISVNRREMRVCCLQNKYEKQKGGFDITSFKADMRQFYLLKMRPVFERSGKKCSLLRNAICYSVGAYGVFYRKDTQFDMNYFSASILEFFRDGPTGRLRHVKKNCCEPKFISRNKPTGRFVEQQYSDSIVDFGDALENMQIGTPFRLVEGLIDLGDINIVDAVDEVLDYDIADMKNIREIVQNRPQFITYRTAIVIRGSEETEDQWDIE